MNMRYLISAAALAIAAPVAAQDTTTNTTNSNAGAVSGSLSGAESNGNQQGQSQANIGGNNAGIGSSTSESNSGAVAITSSDSASRSNSDQNQGQGQGQDQRQNASSDQGQSQTQGQDAHNANTASNANTLGQTASNSQGVNVATTFNTYDRKINRVYTNNAVPLAASSSFSSDYCGGTVSGGASAAPIGISIGGSGPVFDKSCQSLRRAEKFGMLAANYSNMGYADMAMKAMSLMAWSICTADSGGPKADKATAEACAQVFQMGGAAQAAGAYAVPPPPAPRPVTPLETQKPNVQPLPNDYVPYEDLKTPRGDAGKPTPMAVNH